MRRLLVALIIGGALAGCAHSPMSSSNNAGYGTGAGSGASGLDPAINTPGTGPYGSPNSQPNTVSPGP